MTHVTKKITDGGTDERITILLQGSKTSLAQVLDTPGNDREQGKKDIYEFVGPDIGTITGVGFRMTKVTHDGNYPWCCDWVKVEDLDTNTSVKISDYGWVHQFDHDFWRVRRGDNWINPETPVQNMVTHVIGLSGHVGGSNGEPYRYKTIEPRPIKNYQFSYMSPQTNILITGIVVNGNELSFEYDAVGAVGWSFAETVFLDIYF